MIKIYDFIENQLPIRAIHIFMTVDSKAKYIFKNKDGVIGWSDSKPIKTENEFICGLNSTYGFLGHINISEFEDKDWVDCIIEKETPKKEWIGCLCWFYNDDPMSFYHKELGILTKIENSDVPYVSNTGSKYKCVKPVKKSEFKFLEDCINND